MTNKSRPRRAFFWLRRREDIAREVDVELRLHLDLTIEELMAEGLDRAAAREEAERRFGNFEYRRRECTEFGVQQLKSERRTEVMNEFIRDIRFALRMAFRKPVFSIVIILTLALGIGINAAIFSVVDGVLLRPLPYQNPDQLARVWGANRETGQQFLEVSYKDFMEFRQHSRAFGSMVAFSQAPRILRDNSGEPQNITVARVSGSLFSVLGVPPSIGRDFLDQEYSQGERAVVLSHRLWQSRYGSNPGVLGHAITIDNEMHTVVGVMPPGYSYPREADLWRPLTEAEKEDDDPELFVIGRLAPGATIEQAATEVGAIASRIEQANPESNAGRAAWAQSMHGMVVRDARTPLLVLLAAVALVLLIACANIANLLLARSASREQEMAIRAALGASRARIARQLLTESLLFAAVGGALGLFFGYWTLDAIVAMSPGDIPRLSEVALDERVMAVMAAVTTAAGIAFGLVPAIRASKPGSHDSLKGSGRTSSAGAEKHRLLKGLVIAEVALATVLVIGAGLLIKSFNQLLNFDRGFRAENVLTVPISLRGINDPQFVSFYDQVLERAGSLPGVQSAALALRTPMEARGFKIPFQIEGIPVSSAERPSVMLRPITPGYFRTAGIPLVSGREFNDLDRQDAPFVTIINETFARTFFPGSDPVGRRLIGELNAEQSIVIVGVAADVIPDAETAPAPEAYLPFHQLPFRGMTLLVRTADDPRNLVASIRERIWSLNPNVPLDRIQTLEQKVSETFASSRFNTMLLAAFASLALMLAAIGIYGVMSYTVAGRTREIGIRRAIGAQEAGILWMVMKQGLALTLTGLLIGMVAAFWITGLLSALLFEISATDPLTFAVVALVIATVALAACYLPARRAARVDPMAALRSE